MGTCEMCGRDVPGLRRATVEGTVMSVCSNCVRFGVEIAGPKVEVTGRSTVAQSMERRAKRTAPRDIYNQMEEELVPDYGDRVRDGRQRKGWSTEELAKNLMEKEGTIKQVEAGTFHPPDPLVKKLERELDIKLMEKPEAPVGVGGPKPSNKALTLGDLLKQELDKRKK